MFIRVGCDPRARMLGQGSLVCVALLKSHATNLSSCVASAVQNVDTDVLDEDGRCVFTVLLLRLCQDSCRLCQDSFRLCQDSRRLC